MFDLGLSTCGKEINRQLFSDYADAKIADMEISEADYSEFDFAGTYALAKEYGINLWSLHLPFVPFEKIEISSTDEDLRKSTIVLLSEIIKKSADIGIDKFIIHPSGEPIDDSIREERKKRSRETLSELADVAEKCNAVICVEDLPRTCLGHSAEEMKFLIAEDERLRVCIDTNHITEEKPEDIITALGDKLATVHISDFDFVNERHWLPGEGKINWQAVVSAFKTVGYEGPWLYEIGFACPETILRDRDLNVYDFARNRNEVLGGEKITVFSKPKPGLGFWR